MKHSLFHVLRFAFLGVVEGVKSSESEKENTQSPPVTSCTVTSPGGPTLITFPVVPIPAHLPSAAQPAFSSPTPESTDNDATPVSLPGSNGDSKTTAINSPEVKIPHTSVYLSPGKVGQVDSRDSKENQSKVFAPITWPPVVLGNAPLQGQPVRSQKTSPKSSPPTSTTASSTPSSAPSTPLKVSPASSATNAAVISPSLAKPTPTVVGMPSGIPTAPPGVPPVTISAVAVPAGYHEYMASMMARYNMMAQNAR